jgi:hypothetical protein
MISTRTPWTEEVDHVDRVRAQCGGVRAREAPEGLKRHLAAAQAPRRRRAAADEGKRPEDAPGDDPRRVRAHDRGARSPAQQQRVKGAEQARRRQPCLRGTRRQVHEACELDEL